MVVVIARHLPPAVRGRMKLWFLEPEPNVFVSGVKDAIAEKIIEHLFNYSHEESSLILFKSIKSAPGFEIKVLGEPKKTIEKLSGLQLIAESIHHNI
jgi:CRISPR-associated protein Cas2